MDDTTRSCREFTTLLGSDAPAPGGGGAAALAGALGAAMTGTGTAVFGIFADESTAQAAFGKLKARYEHTYFVHPLTNTRYAV